MQTAWEYTIIEIYANMPREGVQEILCDQGRDGWEHYAIRNHPDPNTDTDVGLLFYYFKRPK